VVSGNGAAQMESEMERVGIIYGSVTGNSQATVRAGFADADTYGEGFVFAARGNLDAPTYMPQGSVRLQNHMKQHPVLSLAHRDGEDRSLYSVGACHDGPEAATLWLPKE